MKPDSCYLLVMNGSGNLVHVFAIAEL